MYADCPENIASITSRAETIVLDNDRSLYDPFISAIGEFVINKGIVCGGKIGLGLITNKLTRFQCYYWELYCDDTFNTAKALANVLYKVVSPFIPSYTVSVRTDLKHKEFTLYVNVRALVKFYAMDAYRSTVLIDLIRVVYGAPSMLDHFTIDSAKIRCLPEEVALINIYRTLYRPSDKGLKQTWDDAYALEQLLFEHLEVAHKTGGGVLDDIAKAVNANYALICAEYIIIGEYALKEIGIVDRVQRLAFISAASITSIVDTVTNIISRKVTAFGEKNIKIKYVRQNMGIPIDFQLTKHSLYAVDGANQIFIADVYNSTQYEIIPRVKIGNVFVASHWVILRFLFIEIWVLELIGGLKNDKKSVEGKQKIIHVWARKLQAHQWNRFPLDYTGQYLNEMAAKKLLMQGNIPNYYPAAE